MKIETFVEAILGLSKLKDAHEAGELTKKEFVEESKPLFDILLKGYREDKDIVKKVFKDDRILNLSNKD